MGSRIVHAKHVHNPSKADHDNNRSWWLMWGTWFANGMTFPHIPSWGYWYWETAERWLHLGQAWSSWTCILVWEVILALQQWQQFSSSWSSFWFWLDRGIILYLYWVMRGGREDFLSELVAETTITRLLYGTNGRCIKPWSHFVWGGLVRGAQIEILTSYGIVRSRPRDFNFQTRGRNGILFLYC